MIWLVVVVRLGSPIMIYWITSSVRVFLVARAVMLVWWLTRDVVGLFKKLFSIFWNFESVFNS